jgi:hypothetical protein
MANNDELEFVHTATDMAIGAQYDAVHCGATYDKASQVVTEATPSPVEAGDGLLAGLDAWR